MARNRSERHQSSSVVRVAAVFSLLCQTAVILFYIDPFGTPLLHPDLQVNETSRDADPWQLALRSFDGLLGLTALLILITMFVNRAYHLLIYFALFYAIIGIVVAVGTGFHIMMLDKNAFLEVVIVIFSVVVSSILLLLTQQTRKKKSVTIKQTEKGVVKSRNEEDGKKLVKHKTKKSGIRKDRMPESLKQEFDRRKPSVLSTKFGSAIELDQRGSSCSIQEE